MKRFVCLFSVIIILFISCSRSSDELEYVASTNVLAEVVPSKGSNEDIPRKLIKNGSIRFQTDDTGESYRFILGAVKRAEGYISDERTYNYNSSNGYELTIRVPADKFDKLLADIIASENIRKLEEKSTTIQDVTEEFIDVQARLKIKKESELRLLELLKQAKNVTDIVKINEQLTNLRADIESIEGRLRYLENQVSLSTLNVNFYKKTKYSGRFFDEISTGFAEGWQIFLHLLTLLSYLWVIIIVLIIIWRVIAYVRRKRRNRKLNIH